MSLQRDNEQRKTTFLKQNSPKTLPLFGIIICEIEVKKYECDWLLKQIILIVD